MKSRLERVCVLGLGYVGLPTAVILANRGVDVIGVDVNPRVVDTINAGQLHFVEPELDVLVNAAVVSRRLKATTKPEPADAFIIAVPTPVDGSHAPDMSYVESAGRLIAPVLKAGDIVILESTSPVGSTERLADMIKSLRPDLIFPQDAPETATIHFAYCPERLLPGNVLRELVENDRVVGGISPRCAEKATAVYRTFISGTCFQTNARTAEMVKLSENAFRDVNIAFANELARIAETFGIDVWHLIELANRHPRVKILQPGIGVGGHCISVDPWFLVHAAPDRARLIRTAREVNDARPHQIVERILAEAAQMDRPRIACLGLAYKPDTDDLRESPAVEVVKELARNVDTPVTVADPYINEPPVDLRSNDKVRFVPWGEATFDYDLIAILVGHSCLHEMEIGSKSKVLNFVNKRIG